MSKELFKSYNLLDQLYKTVFNYFYNQSDKQDVTCEVDNNPVDCLTFKLEDKGFTYNKEEDWWERTWSVPTKTGEETSKEVYKLEGEVWKSMMFGNTGELFYEQTVGTRTDGYITI